MAFSFKNMVCMCLLLAPYAHAGDITNLGGDLTTDNQSIARLQVAAPNLSSEKKVDLHFSGHSVFHLPLDLPDTPIKEMRVGPSFNHTTCGGCHINDGQGPVEFAKGGSALLLKVGLKGLKKNGVPKDVPGVGEQLQDNTVTGKTQFNLGLDWIYSIGSYSDGTSYELRKPKVSFTIPRVKKNSVVTSLRRTPAIIGMGLLESIPVETLKALSDPQDKNNDGISGKLSYVLDLEKPIMSIGRFGFKATHASIRQQAAAALFNDMGVTTRIIRGKNNKVELNDKDLKALTFYMQVSGVPPARDQDKPNVIAGKGLFKKIGCSDCHSMTLKTGVNKKIPELSNQTIHPFTDLLLHDMGPGLADTRPEFSAKASEWRTTPLWGIGLTEILTTKEPGFLHDGRARTLEEAILWHDGEAKRSKRNFR